MSHDLTSISELWNDVKLYPIAQPATHSESNPNPDGFTRVSNASKDDKGQESVRTAGRALGLGSPGQAGRVRPSQPLASSSPIRPFIDRPRQGGLGPTNGRGSAAKHPPDFELLGADARGLETWKCLNCDAVELFVTKRQRGNRHSYHRNWTCLHEFSRAHSVRRRRVVRRGPAKSGMKSNRLA